MYRIKISDLRRLSLSGNATVKLDKAYKYQIGEIRRDGIYIKQIGIVKGKRSEIKMRETFAKMYSHIQTIKQGKVLIGERRNDELIATSTFEKKVKEELNREKRSWVFQVRKFIEKRNVSHDNHSNTSQLVRYNTS
ncbi:MAG: hypothetical protein LKK07_08165 [Lactococcus lactis]|jgi:hypothetical protein|nr:hypothetical protein [Lactococcus lactis]MCI2190219.1 hypothetical protein [Lactococcus lactis]